MSSSSRKMLQAAAGNAGGDFYPYTVDYSARFNEADSPKLVRSHSSSGNTQKGTFSLWVKRSAVTEQQLLIMVTSSAGNDVDSFSCQFNASDEIQVENQGGSLRTNARYRDVSAWLHIVVQADTTQSTASNRTKLWVNGEQITSFAFADYPALNASGYNLSTHQTGFSEIFAGSRFFEGYVSQFIFCDGQTYTASDFGESKNGVWVPKEITGLTFGTNGFYLDFSNSAALGTDVSGNNNDFTSSGLTSADQVTDTPTNNYCVLNPIALWYGTGNAPTLSDGNLTCTSDAFGTSPIPKTGKWYFEVTVDTVGTASSIGIDNRCGGYYRVGDSRNGVLWDFCFYKSDGTLQQQSGNTGSWGSSYTSGDIIGVEVDSDNDQVTFYKNNVSQGTASLGLSISDGQGQFWLPAMDSNGSTFTCDFGQNGFTYTPPTDALALSSANFPEPTIGPNSTVKLEDVFVQGTYTGNGTAIGSGGKSINAGVDMTDGDWMVTIKNRDAADQWMVFDTVRGAGKYISFDGIDAEVTDTESLNAFTATGFDLGSNVAVNTSGEDYVWYAFKVTAGFFDIVQYSGAGGNQNISHSLGVAPDFLTVKELNTSTYDWQAYCSSLPVPDPETDRLTLSQNFPVLDQADMWNDTAPTTTQFTVGTNAQVSVSGTDNYIAYLWADSDISKVFYYEGNGNADGTFVYAGNASDFVFYKRTNSTGNWVVQDTERSPYNNAQDFLYLNLSNAESGGSDLIDFLGTGFKVRNTFTVSNASGGDYIGLSIGQPFKYSNAR